MSRAFVKDADYPRRTARSGRSPSIRTIVTEAGLAQIETCPSAAAQRSLRRRASISRSRGPLPAAGLDLRYSPPGPARTGARRTGPDRPLPKCGLGTSVTIVRDDGQGADVSDRRRRRSRPRQRLDLTCSSPAGEIDVSEKARRRRGQRPATGEAEIIRIH